MTLYCSEIPNSCILIEFILAIDIPYMLANI